MTLRGRWSAMWPTRRSRALDVALALGAAVVDAVWLYLAPQAFWVPPAGVAACSVVLGLSLLFRRRHPVALAIGYLAVSTVFGGGGTSAQIMLYSLGAYARSRRTAIAVAVGGLIAFAIFPGPTETDENLLVKVIFAFTFTAVPVLLGMYMGARKQLFASLQERAERLERERDLLSERARSEERARIAREMHDVVANRVSVMVVHAGALKAVAPRDPVQAAETAVVIGDMGRQALDELRQVIGVLRQGSEALPEGSPTLADIRGLVEQSSAAGLGVELSVRGAEAAMPAAVSRALYRLVQEALTNVHKHAGVAATTVELTLTPEAVDVEVVNEPPSEDPRHGLPSGRNGLVGLRERVHSLGGRFEAGPCADGGFAVRARLPLPAA